MRANAIIGLERMSQTPKKESGGVLSQVAA